VEDTYGNMTAYIDKGKISLLEDVIIPKDKWKLWEANDTIGGVPMGFFDGVEGRKEYLIDDIIDDGKNTNYVHTAGRGRTGLPKDGNVPWNVMIDLDEEYELSRIVTYQRNSYGSGVRGQYYRDENVGIYNLYIWDEPGDVWDSITQNKILFPAGLTDMEYRQLGLAGDVGYFYPDDPKFTAPTRWFRYEAVKGFNSNYTNITANCLSEITLYAKKKE
jgi:hypothetical protein